MRTLKWVSVGLCAALLALGCITGCRAAKPSIAPKASGSAELPAAFDLRDVDGHDYVTPVKIQCGTTDDGVPDLGETVGGCWGFGSLASFESSLLKQGIVDDPAAPSVDLSEWHLLNFNGYNDPVFEFHTTPMPGTDPPAPSSYTEMEPVLKGWGGPSYWAIDYFASGKGPVLEGEVPYPTADISARRTLTPPPRAARRAYRLKEARILRYDDFGDAAKLRLAVKKALVRYGVIQSFVFFDAGGYPGQVGKSFFDKTTNDLYVNDAKLTGNLNHAVAIVGWDDARTVAGAPRPGAWLVKNSVGPNFADKGFMWVSYEDEVTLKENSFAISFVGGSIDGYGDPGTYQTHDGALSTLRADGAKSWEYESTASKVDGASDWGFGRFVADGPTTIAAVGLMNVNRDEDVEVAVYRGWTEKGPGPQLSSGRAKLDDAGYYTIDLDKRVDLADGEEFVVGVGFDPRERRAQDPLVYVLDAKRAADAKTYLGTRDAAGVWGGVKEFGSVERGGMFYVQAISRAVSVAP